jgi:uncharacterized circularly permuted ATP-grasp superfamily protein
MTLPRPTALPFTDGWNEAFEAPGRPRPLYGSLLRALEGVNMASLTAAVGESMQAAQATFGSDPLVVCPIPRLIESGEWAALSAGLAQRVRALSSSTQNWPSRSRTTSSPTTPSDADPPGHRPRSSGS